MNEKSDMAERVGKRDEVRSRAAAVSPAASSPDTAATRLPTIAGTPEEANDFLRQARFDAWGKRVPRLFSHATVETLDERIAVDVRSWQAKRRDAPGTNYVIAGPRGVGKTHLAYAVLREEFLSGFSVLAWQTIDLLDALRPGNSDNAGEILRQLGTVDVLLLDDLGATRSTEWTLERFTGLVDKRYRESLATIITTNLNQQQAREVLGDRAADRLYSDAVVSLVDGASRRRGIGA